jgi:hypothetical protein
VETGEECNIYRLIGLVWVRRLKMLDLTNVKTPIETADGLPNGCYVDADLYQHEQNTLFCTIGQQSTLARVYQNQAA